MLDLGSEKGVLEKSGSWYSFKGERIGQGRDNARQTLISRPELRASAEAELRNALGFGESPKKPAEFELRSSDPRVTAAAR